MEGAINNLGSKASTTGCKEERTKKAKWNECIKFIRRIINFSNRNSQSFTPVTKDYLDDTLEISQEQKRIDTG